MLMLKNSKFAVNKFFMSQNQQIKAEVCTAFKLTLAVTFVILVCDLPVINGL